MTAPRRIGIATLVVIAACVPARPADDPQPSPPQRIDRPAASLALDRITKREAILDGVDRHRGNGRGVTVYVFDGGIDTASAELRSRVRRGFRAFDDSLPFCNPHGTAVAAAIAGRTLGVASAATIVDVNVIKCDTWRGSTTALLAATRWTLEDHARHPGPAIANWSLIADSTRNIPALDAAIESLRAAGIVVIVAAGNLDRNACDMSPANSGAAFVVGASSLVRGADGQLRDVRTSGTAWGECVDLYAPGDSVPLPCPGEPRAVTLWRGTSMAAGYTSGAAAILLERHPGATPDSVMAMLRRGATAEIVEENVANRRPARRSLLYIGGEDQPRGW